MEDFDTLIGFWIKGLPYYWISHSNIWQCKRMYLIPENIKLSVFDDKNHVIAREFLSKETSDLYSLLPLAGKDCDLVRKCYLVDTSSKINTEFIPSSVTSIYSNLEMRVEGVKISLTKRFHVSVMEYPIINIIDPDTKYDIKRVLYPPQFGNPKMCSDIKGRPSLYDIIAPIFIDSTPPQIFHNLIFARDRLKLAPQNIQKIHLEALSNTLIYADKPIALLIETFIQKIDPEYKIGVTINSWRYSYNDIYELISSQIFYEILSGVTPLYSLKNCEISNETKPLTQPSVNLVPTFIPGKIVFGPDSLKITQRITHDRDRDVKKILTKFYKKNIDVQVWSTNKKVSSDFYSWFTKFCANEICKDTYVDIGCGSGSDAISISKALQTEKVVCADVKDFRLGDAKKLKFLKIDPAVNMNIESNSVGVVTMFHTLHHILSGYKERLQDIYRMLKPGGIFVLKDHNVQTRVDCDNVNFEHFVYSIGEGAATIDDVDTYKNIEPMLCFSAFEVSKYLQYIGFKELKMDTFQNPTRTYNAVFQKE